MQEISQEQSRTIRHWSFTTQAQFQITQVRSPTATKQYSVQGGFYFRCIYATEHNAELCTQEKKSRERERERDKADLLFSLKAIIPEGGLVLNPKLCSQNCFHTTSHELQHLPKGYIHFTSTYSHLAGPFGGNMLEFI